MAFPFWLFSHSFPLFSMEFGNFSTAIFRQLPMSLSIDFLSLFAFPTCHIFLQDPGLKLGRARGESTPQLQWKAQIRSAVFASR